MLRFKAIEPALVTRGCYPFEDGWQGVHSPFVCYFGSTPKNVTTTSTSTSTPWGPQQPFLQSGFNFAGDLLGQAAPQQIYPVAPFNDTQLSALSGITGLAAGGTPITAAATGFDTNLENGAFLGSNPALGYFSSLAGNNIGLNNPGATALTGLAVGTGPGQAALGSYANGNFLNSNPYQDPTAQSIEAQVIPQIASAFNNGNNVNNPAMAYAAGQGVTAALAPIEYQNYQTQEGLQQGAANSLANTAAGAGTSLNSGAISGGNLQATGAEGISQPYQQTLTNMVQGNLAAPGNQALSYADLGQLLNAGTIQQQQAQAGLSGAAQSYNYSQLSPYQQLAAYMQAVNGAYGGTTSGTQTTPYFSNGMASGIGGVLGLNSIGSQLGIGGSGGPLGALGSSLGLDGLFSSGLDVGASDAAIAGTTDGLLSSSSALLPGAADAGSALVAMLPDFLAAL